MVAGLQEGTASRRAIFVSAVGRDWATEDESRSMVGGTEAQQRAIASKVEEMVNFQ